MTDDRPDFDDDDFPPALLGAAQAQADRCWVIRTVSGFVGFYADGARVKRMAANAARDDGSVTYWGPKGSGIGPVYITREG